VAGLSHGVLVVEGSVKSGALITARLALEEGRCVFAVPGNIYSAGAQGPLHLIKSGAAPVSCGDDILKDLNWALDEAARPLETSRQQSLLLEGISEEDRQLLELISYDPIPIEAVQLKSGLLSAQLGERLTMMELDGLVILLPGANVCRK
jgi:DNA processing protein